MFELVEEQVVQGARIKVIGVGGAGGNALNTMIEDWGLSGFEDLRAGVDFIAANTDLQALKGNRAPIHLQLGSELTKGLGAGADPEIGRKAAIENEAQITKLLEGADMVFITAGMGGGTGTGGAPVIARVARELGILTIGVVTKPFHFEGKRRARYAGQGIELLQESVDSLITIPNERLLVVAGKEMAMVDAFKRADEVLLHAVRGISDLILVKGLINLDFADVRTVMREMGTTLMGSGVASGEHRSIEAATRAISSPLLENVSIRGATGILLNVTGGKDLTLFEVNEAAKLVQEEVDEEANIIFGAVIDERMKETIRVTVIATGFDKAKQRPVSFIPYRQEIPVGQTPEEQLGLAAAPIPGPVVRPFRHKIPLHTDLKKMMGEIGPQGLANQEPDGDEYDIPTFLRKHAD